MRLFKNIIWVLTLFLAAACNDFYEPHYKDTRELMVSERNFVIPSEGVSDTTLTVYAIGQVNMEFIDGKPEWLTLASSGDHDDILLTVSCGTNESDRRMARVRFSIDETTICDTLYIKQKGVDDPFLESALPFQTVGGVLPETADFEINTNIPGDKLKKEIHYNGTSDEEWAEVTEITGKSLKVLARENKSDKGRKAVIELTYVDGWSEVHRLELFLTQTSRNGEIGTEVPFSQVRGMATAEGVLIGEDLILEGVIVSDCMSRNMALNPAVNYNAVDSTYALRTAYFQDTDGKYGFRIMFDKPSDNIFGFGTRLRLNLYGLKVVREDNPERYTIWNVSSSDMVSAIEGGAVQPEVKRISDLTPEDIYTYVSLSDTEFAFKDGAFANVHERFALKSVTNQHLNPYGRLDGWGSLLTDLSGNSILAPVNMHCTWRRTGTGVPKGIGSVAGVIVHEQMPRWGNAGPFQIRVIGSGGFGQSWDSDSHFTDFARFKGQTSGDLTDVYLPENSENAKLYIENHTGTQLTSYENAVVQKENLNSLYAEKSATGDKIEGETPSNHAIWTASALEGWFDYDGSGNVNGYKGFRIELNTSGIAGSVGISMTFDMAAGNYSMTTAKMFPAHWCVEYQVEDGERIVLQETYTGENYFHLRPLPYTDSMNSGYQYRQNLRSAMGYVQHAFLLPPETLGKEKVSVWIRPYDNVLTTVPLQWNAETETEKMRKGMTVDTYIRFGEINFRYR